MDRTEELLLLLKLRSALSYLAYNELNLKHLDLLREEVDRRIVELSEGVK